MPWNQTDPMNERTGFIDTYLAGVYTMSELCSRFGVSRKTGYKWLNRFLDEGRAGLADRSRAPQSCPHRTAPEIERLIVAKRKEKPSWGAPMIVDRLRTAHPDLKLPAYSTAGDILKRHGLIAGRRRRRGKAKPERVPLQTTACNQVWGLDYKGQFLLGNAQYCYPLTATDQHSRLVVACQAHTAISGQHTRVALEAAFHEYGLPMAIRTDNGTPFVTHGTLGLSKLGVWWIKLGIVHQRIEPAKPWQNPRHERMHRTLKAETTRPPEANHKAQQRRFDAFVYDFNHHRPHQGIGRVPPASAYTRSTREMPTHLAEPQYPGHFEVRRVSNHGVFSFKGKRMTLSTALAHEDIALEQIDDDIWSIFYYDRLLARLDEPTSKIIP